MLTSLELLVGVVCSLMGIAVGYTVLVSLLAGIQLFSKKRNSDS